MRDSDYPNQEQYLAHQCIKTKTKGCDHVALQINSEVIQLCLGSDENVLKVLQNMIQFTKRCSF